MKTPIGRQDRQRKKHSERDNITKCYFKILLSEDTTVILRLNNVAVRSAGWVRRRKSLCLLFGSRSRCHHWIYIRVGLFCLRD
jgi:hypothetical protein